MTIEQQATFGETVGMEPVVPTRKHYDDQVECSDGNTISHGEAYYDYEGNPHSTDEDRHEQDVRVVSDFLDGVAGWVTEYATENDDYTSGYDHIIGETSHDWPDRMDEWFSRVLDDWTGHSKYDDYRKVIIAAMCEEFDGEWDGDWEYNSNEYAGYTGKGCCIFGFDIGECEEQLSIADHPILRHFHDAGILDDILDDVDCDLYVSRSKRREKNEETGHYEGVGRETYDPYRSDYPDVLGYVCPGGRWDFIVSADKMKELFSAAVIGICGK